MKRGVTKEEIIHATQELIAPARAPPGCLHDHVIACFNFIIFRTEIINLAYITKSHAYYFCHSISP